MHDDTPDASRPQPPRGIATTPSPYTFDETVDRLLAAFDRAELTLFCVIDHAAGALGVGLHLQPEKLLVFGNPTAGTPAMTARPEIGLELPLRLLVWQDDRQQVSVSRQDTSDWPDRFGVDDDVLAPLSRVAVLVDAALTPRAGSSRA
ncbi:DUF302 domain-containing protein [Streptomyces sp. NPDC055952]|uniref:DUF302 domain-containing protein n=1 Tax=Streptomyces sp. NPDC055952 TaxID=3345663 RepID=UPI0035DE8603